MSTASASFNRIFLMVDAEMENIYISLFSLSSTIVRYKFVESLSKFNSAENFVRCDLIA